MVTTELMVDDLALFSRLQLGHQCMDPELPVLRSLELGMEREQAIWYTLLFSSYMRAPSVELAFQRMPDWHDIAALQLTEPLLKYPTGYERRGLRRAESMLQYLRDLCFQANIWKGLWPWLTADWIGDPQKDWLATVDRLDGVWGNGRWAAFTAAEMLKCVNDWPIEAPSLGMEDCSGPRKGLEHIYGEVEGNTPGAYQLLNDRAELLIVELAKRGTALRMDELETVLCDFHSLAVGDHYVGHDVDLEQEHLLKMEETHPGEFTRVWAARLYSLPERFLGEVGGWVGVDKGRNKVYLQTRQIVDR